jgi:hypothetical protein
MAENESLTAKDGIATEERVRERLDDGESVEDLWPEIETEFFKKSRGDWNRLRRRKIDVRDVLSAALNNPKEFACLLRQSAYNPVVKLLGEVARSNQYPNQERLTEAFLLQYWEVFACRIQLNRRDACDSPKIIQLSQRMLKKLADSLCKDSSRFPKPRPNSEQILDLDSQLSVSLL